MYDYLIVGSGLYGAVCARELTDAGKKVLVIDKRTHIAGNVYTKKVEGISVHVYGAHIFHDVGVESLRSYRFTPLCTLKISYKVVICYRMGLYT